MCTSIISNRKKTIVGWNLDFTEMKVYWCENRQWDHINKKVFDRLSKG